MRFRMMLDGDANPNAKGAVVLSISHVSYAALGITTGHAGVVPDLSIQSRSWQVTAPFEGIT